jgi:hypothetical protein
MSETNHGGQVDVKQLEALVARHSGQGVSIPRGTYSGRVVRVEPYVGTPGWRATRAVIEVTVGPHAGAEIAAVLDDRWQATRLARKAAGNGEQVAFDVFVRRYEDGRSFSAVSGETIRWLEKTPVGDTPWVPDRYPTAEEIATAAAIYPYGFACIGAKEARRIVMPWAEAHRSMADATAKFLGKSVFLSAFTFSDEFVDYVNDQQKPGSVAGYRGPAYSPLLCFDIDRRDAAGRPDPAAARTDVEKLLVVLTEIGFPDESITVYYSGLKGFHVDVASSLVGAMPSDNFPAIARQFCLLIAEEADIEIDLSLYSLLQPLRAPNSRHEVSGLFKVSMTVSGFRDLSLDEMRELATEPRGFVPPPVLREPVPGLAEIWAYAKWVTSSTAREPDRDSRTIGGDARIFGQTWEFLIGGAPEGERAVALFRAAANLADFESRDDLIRALLDRGVMRSGLALTEAAAHVDSALRRATEARRPD